MNNNELSRDETPNNDWERFYVYALIDPKTKVPFYIGKGANDRVKNHFKNIKSDNENSIAIIEESESYKLDAEEILSEKTQRIIQLFDQGYEFGDIARILASRVSEEVALALEAYSIKTVYGFDNLTNLVQGHHHERFRMYGNMDLIENLDYINKERKKPTSREPMLKMRLKEKYDIPLIKAASMIEWMEFDNPKILDSGELGIEGDYLGTRIKIAIKKQIYAEIRPRKRNQKDWMKNHFEGLGLLSYLRKDCVFNVPLGRGKNRKILTIEALVERVNSYKRILDADSYDDLIEFDIELLKSMK